MKIAVGADHAGFELKERIRTLLEARGHEVRDMGTSSGEPTDYPQYAFRVAEAVRDGGSDRGLLVCDSGNGIAIAANKVQGIRATICNNPKQAELARRHNDSNILVLGSAYIASADVERTLDAWLTAPVDGGRHARRVGQISDYERAHERR